MAAVIGVKEESLKEIMKEHWELNLYIANYNTDEQIILSGKKVGILKGKS